MQVVEVKRCFPGLAMALEISLVDNWIHGAWSIIYIIYIYICIYLYHIYYIYILYDRYIYNIRYV